MGSSPYSPVIPLVICLPPRPLTGALMPPEKRRSILVAAQPPASHLYRPPFLTSFTSVAHSEMPQAVLCNVTPDLTQAKPDFLKAS